MDKEAISSILNDFAEALGWELPGKTIEIGSIHSFAALDWHVLDVQNGKALLLSDKVIEKKAYHSLFAAITWEECELRSYLDGAFYNSFGQDKTRIAETKLANKDNPWYNTSGGNATTDRVFLLSLDEVVQYFGNSGDLKNRKDWELKDGKYILAHGSGYYIHDQFDKARIAYDSDGKECLWWLRSPGCVVYGSRRFPYLPIFGVNSFFAASVGGDGAVYVGGCIAVSESSGVRPALWLNL